MSGIEDVREYLEKKVKEFTEAEDEYSYQGSLEISDFGVDDGCLDIAYSYKKAASLCQYFINLIKIEEMKDAENINLTKMVKFLEINLYGIDDAVDKYIKEHKND